MIKTALKTAAIAIVIVAGTAGASFAKTAWAEEDTKVKDDASKYADTIDWLYEGEKVDVEWCGDYYCYVEHKGPDGFVRKSDLEFKKGKKDDFDVEFCLGGGGWGGGGFGFGELCITD
jgi:hypothetical protein